MSTPKKMPATKLESGIVMMMSVLAGIDFAGGISVDTVWILTSSGGSSFGMGFAITAANAVFWIAGLALGSSLIFGFTTYWAWKDHNKKAERLAKEIDSHIEKQNNLRSQLVDLNNKISLDVKLSPDEIVKPKFSPAIIKGLFMGAATYSSLLGTVWGAMSVLGGVLPAVAALGAIPVIGWGILAGALVVGVAMGCLWAYYTHKNSKRKAVCQNLEKQNIKLEKLIEDEKTTIRENKMKHRSMPAPENKKVNNFQRRYSISDFSVLNQVETRSDKHGKPTYTSPGLRSK